MRNRRIKPLHERKRVTIAKIKCEGGFPCLKCVKSKHECVIPHGDDKPINPTDYKENYTKTRAYNCKLERIVQYLFPDISLKYLRENTDEFEKEVCINKSRLPNVAIPITSDKHDEQNLEMSMNSSLNHFDRAFVSTTDQSFIQFIEQNTQDPGQRCMIPACVFSKSNDDLRRNLQLLVTDSIRLLPSDDQVRKLISIYLNICETNYFYVQHSRFYKEVDDFLERKSLGDLEYLTTNWSTLALLLIMLAISSGFEFIADNSEMPKVTPNTTPGLVYYYSALPFTGFLLDLKALESIQALIMFGVFMTTNKLENFQLIDGGYMFMNLALEIAVANKLHLKETYKNHSKVDQEVYKRLWWTCYTMERRHGINIGKAESISPEDITVDFPEDMPEFYNSLGYSNHLSQISTIQINFIYRDIMQSFYSTTKSKKDTKVSIDPKLIRKLVEDLEECKLNFPDYAKIDNLDPNAPRYRGCIHLNQFYYLAKIYIGKPFLLYKVENYKRLNENNGYESAFVDHLSSICIDAAFCCVELLSELQKYNKLGLFSCTDINVCNIALFAILVFLKIDRSETTLLFLRKGLSILKIMSDGSASAKSALQKLQKLDKLVSDLSELDDFEKDIKPHRVLGDHESASKSFPIDISNQDQLLEFGNLGTGDTDANLIGYMHTQQNFFNDMGDFLLSVDDDIFDQLKLSGFVE
ncbi:putative transcriptional regulatory protein [Candida tropicalis]